MASYDSVRFAPAAPVALVDLRNLNRSAVVTGVPMLLDTGADVTIVPRSAVERLGLSLAGAATYELLSFDGKSSGVPALHLELVLAGRSFRGQFLVLENDVGIAGRNVLNLLEVRYDGPRLTWTVDGAAR